MNSSRRIRVLLDTTYLLPMVGIEVRGITKVLERLRCLLLRNRLTVYYTPFNLLELLGKVSKHDFVKDVVEKGLSLITEKFIETTPTLEGYMLALELKRRGFPDLIDLLLYATAVTRNLLFLTRDNTLINFLADNKAPLENVIHEDEFLRKISCED